MKFSHHTARKTYGLFKYFTMTPWDYLLVWVCKILQDISSFYNSVIVLYLNKNPKFTQIWNFITPLTTRKSRGELIFIMKKKIVNLSIIVKCAKCRHFYYYCQDSWHLRKKYALVNHQERFQDDTTTNYSCNMCHCARYR